MSKKESQKSPSDREWTNATEAEFKEFLNQPDAETDCERLELIIRELGCLYAERAEMNVYISRLEEHVRWRSIITPMRAPKHVACCSCRYCTHHAFEQEIIGEKRETNEVF